MNSTAIQTVEVSGCDTCGPCDVCGVEDCHRVLGLCPTCQQRVAIHRGITILLSLVSDLQLVRIKDRLLNRGFAESDADLVAAIQQLPDTTLFDKLSGDVRNVISYHFAAELEGRWKRDNDTPAFLQRQAD